MSQATGYYGRHPSQLLWNAGTPPGITSRLGTGEKRKIASKGAGGPIRDSSILTPVVESDKNRDTFPYCPKGN